MPIPGKTFCTSYILNGQTVITANAEICPKNSVALFFCGRSVANFPQ